ncbi:MAG: hypothetical protein C4308_07385 [Chitinophagaceae bacterium]
MASHNDFGKQAEQMAVDFLLTKGYEILHRNWKHSHYEIDIIGMKDKILRIVEVKALQSTDVCFPEESVTKKKFNYLLKAADEFLYQHPQYTDVRFEILSITIHPNNQPEYFLIEDVYF